jgi:hypothetical protein
VHASDHGVGARVEPLNRFETSVLNLTADAIPSSIASGTRRAVCCSTPSHEHRGAVDRRRASFRRVALKHLHA